jgi:hypothetical protein
MEVAIKGVKAADRPETIGQHHIHMKTELVHQSLVSSCKWDYLLFLPRVANLIYKGIGNHKLPFREQIFNSRNRR